MSEISYNIKSKSNVKCLNKRDILIMSFSICTSFIIFFTIWKSMIQLLSNRFQTSYITIWADIISITTALFICKNTNLSISSLHLSLYNIKSIMFETIPICVVCGLILFLFKILFLKCDPNFFPSGISFIDLNQIDITDLFYPITCLIQEILIRNFFQSNIKKLFKSSKNCTLIAIIVTSLFFGLCHFAYGIRYMVAATVYIFLFGFLYEKQQSIWGVTFSHFFLGELGTLLRILL